MTANSTNDDENKPTVQTVKLSPDVKRGLKHRLADTDEKFQGYALRLILQDIAASEPPGLGQRLAEYVEFLEQADDTKREIVADQIANWKEEAAKLKQGKTKTHEQVPRTNPKRKTV